MDSSNKSYFKQFKEFFSLQGLIIIICLLLAYLPILCHNYAFSDDWCKLLDAMMGEHPWGAFETQGGRPLYGILLGWSTYFISNSADLVLFRGISMLLTITFVIGFTCFLRWRGIFTSHKMLELAVPLGIGGAAPIYLYNAWYICFPYSAGLVFTLLSYIVLFGDNGKTNVKRFLIAIFLLTAAFAIYQSVAMLFCLFMALDCVINENEHSIAWRRLGIAGLILAIGMLSALFLAKALPLLLNLQTLPRSKLDWNFYGSIVWFFTQYLPFAVRELWFAGITGLPFVIMGGGCLIGWLKAGKNWEGCLVLLILFVISAAPVLLITEKWIAVRSSCVTISFCVMYFLFLFGTLTEQRAIDAGLATMACFLLIVGNVIGFNKYFIQTSIKDYNELKLYVATNAKNNNKICVNYDLTNRDYTASPRAYSDEIAIRSSAIEWAYPGMLKQIGLELGKTITCKSCGGDGLYIRQVDIIPHKP